MSFKFMGKHFVQSSVHDPKQEGEDINQIDSCQSNQSQLVSEVEEEQKVGNAPQVQNWNKIGNKNRATNDKFKGQVSTLRKKLFNFDSIPKFKWSAN